MMKNKKILCSICLLLIYLMTLSLTCFAKTDKRDSMVYASGEQLDEIYELLQDDSFNEKKSLEIDSLTILKESITPVYTIDLLECARSQEISIKPMWKSHTGLESDGSGNVYIAKLITSDKQFAGSIIFYIENGVAYRTYVSYSEYAPDWNCKSYDASPSYADHAARIADILGEDDFVSVYDVKYVLINDLGSFFYVNNGKHNKLISTGYIYTEDASKSIHGMNYSMDTTTELLNIANDYLAKYEAHLKRVAEWEAAHPGERWNTTGDDIISPIISECSHVDNILDIASYLNIDYSLPAYQEIDNNTRVDNIDPMVILCLVGVAIIIASVIICIVIRTKKKASAKKE